MVPEVNAEAVEGYAKKNIIANPNCSTAQMVVALKPLHDRATIKRVVVSTYQSVSGAGKDGMDELWDQTKGMYVPGQEREAAKFTKQIAFNVIPHIDKFMDDGSTKEEWKMVAETKKIMDTRIKVTATCVRVPVFVGHSEAINIEFEEFLDEDEAREILRIAPGILVVDKREDGGYVTPVECVGDYATFISRIRQDSTIENGLNLWCVSDNLRKGAALKCRSDRRDPRQPGAEKRAEARRLLNSRRQRATLSTGSTWKGSPMRFLATTALVLGLPGMAFADEVLLRADIAEALVFARGAEVTRRVAVDLPEGTHSIVIPMRDLGDASLIEVTGPDGLSIGAPVPLDRIAIAEGSLDSAAEAGGAGGGRCGRGRGAGGAGRIGPPGRGDRRPRDTTRLPRRAVAGAAQMARRCRRTLPTCRSFWRPSGARRRASAPRFRPRGRPAAPMRTPSRSGWTTCRRLRSRSTRSNPSAPKCAASASTCGPAKRSTACWRSPTSPRMRNGGRATPSASTRRPAGSTSNGRSRFTSTDLPSGAMWPCGSRRPFPTVGACPRASGPTPVRIAPPMPEPSVRGGLNTADMAPAMERAVIVEDAARMTVSGLSVVYDYTAPVTIGASGQVTLPFDDLGLAVDLENRAIPRHDATAVLIAMGRNTTGETILPGDARFFRDGDLVGEDALPLIPPGAEVEMGFGPLDHLRLTWQDLSLDEGDRGIFISENEQRRRIAFSVENTSDAAETVRLLYATPFAEQEDIDVDVSFSRAPDETGVDDLRGVAAWALDVPPGETTRIEMEVALTWPEEMILDWRP